MSFPKTMLFSPTPPGQGSVGEQYLRPVCKAFPHDKLCCFSAWSTSYAVWVPHPELEWLPLQTVPLPEEKLQLGGGGMFADTFASWRRQDLHWSKLAPIVDQAVEFGKQHQVEVVFAVLASPSTIMMVKQVVARLKARLVCLVWDPPESTMKQLGFEPQAVKMVMSEFEDLLRSAERAVVASEGMKQDYFLKFNLNCEVLTRFVSESLKQPPRPPAEPDCFTIAFTGTVYAGEEFKALLWALGNVGWRLNDKPVVLKILGNSFDQKLYAGGKPVRVEFLGHRPLEEAVQIVSRADLAYLPYWFDPQFAKSVRQCFPDKLVTYITAGTPILYHGPEDSTPARFFERYPVGVCCHSLETARLESVLTSAASNQDLRDTCYKAGEKAYRELLNEQAFNRRLEWLACSSAVELAAGT